MTIISHYCPSRGRSRLGHEVDCPECYAGLLEAFREPADSDYRPMNQPVPPAGHPHLIMEDTARTVPLGQRIRGVLHDTGFVVEPAGDRRGTWCVVCPCGWRKSGAFMNIPVAGAEKICESWARYHELYPDEPGDEERGENG